ncbi:MAG: thioredoxin [Thermodesulfovibrionales bacterium]
MAEGVFEFNSSNWETEVIGSKGLTVVDFWAAWCGPCKIIAPTIEELAKEYAGKVKIGKLNTDENNDVASKYKIMGIPTIIFFKDGKEIDKIVGAVPKSQLKNKIDSLLS